MSFKQSDLYDKIKMVSEDVINTEILSICPFENITNNRVFKLTAHEKSYIFKIYNSGWPETGKLPFVSMKLDEQQIPHAKIFIFNRENSYFPNGYLIEECLPGTTADRLALSTSETMELFKKIAKLVSKVHKIKLTNYGYIGDGIAEWTTFSEYVYDSFEDCTANLLSHKLISKKEYEKVRHELHYKLSICDQFPAVLCHGDLSLKNVLVNQDDITLIDWDDAHSLCCVADVARLTLWMKLNYDVYSSSAYRKAFLENYKTEYDMSSFEALEDVLHVWYGYDCLNFFVGKPQYENMKSILQKSLSKCEMQVFL
ncbi:MAG: hypothetical protein A2Y17_05835 [Clostridiales bacterium GWF2_38_85]|nr:MAG: hypothetical protein A2Y17_05835 [Clostridiales bacterium GWF2_38_85]HBL83997.1 hypothetical protein [Clostridiales bacterium]